MKRKITELEENLIKNGWVLTEKHYEGKHSERTWFYEYYKNIPSTNEHDSFGAIIYLNPKRDKIVNYGIFNPINLLMGCTMFDYKDLKDIITCMSALSETVESDSKKHSLFDTISTPDYLCDDEQLEVAEIVETENE